MTSEARVKGVAFRTIDLCFREMRGAALHERARTLMPEELADAFRRGTILAATWYPIAWYRETFRAFRAANREGSELVRQIGYQAMRHDMGTYKMMFAKLLSPQMLLSLSQRLFSTYYDTGTARVVEGRRGYTLTRLENCRGFDNNMYVELQGSFTALLEIAGGKEARVHISRGGRDGDDNAEYEGHWI
jgi:uncharacterized protein (TIGR02265 family)